jgi:hypothetical protein
MSDPTSPPPVGSRRERIRRAIPLVVALIAGIACGILSKALELGTTASFAFGAGAVLILVAVGVPFALLDGSRGQQRVTAAPEAAMQEGLSPRFKGPSKQDPYPAIADRGSVVVANPWNVPSSLRLGARAVTVKDGRLIDTPVPVAHPLFDLESRAIRPTEAPA